MERELVINSIKGLQKGKIELEEKLGIEIQKLITQFVQEYHICPASISVDMINATRMLSVFNEYILGRVRVDLEI